MNNKTYSGKNTKNAEHGIIEFHPSRVKLISSNFPISLLLILAIWTIFPLPYFLWQYLQIKCTKYILTNQRLVLKTGVFQKQVHFLEIYRVSDIQIERRFFYQIVDFIRGCLHQKPLLLGDIYIFSSDNSHPTLLVDTIPNSLGIAEKIRQATNDDKEVKRVLRRD